jgi:hypothetical protein
MISYAFLTWIIETVVCPTISMEDPAATCLGNFGDLRFGSGEVLNDQYFPTADLAG